MSDLTQFRDHARLMAARVHAAGCPPERSRPGRAHHDGWKWCRDATSHDAHQWSEPSRYSDALLTWECAGICGGCAPAAERALWAQLAAEIDAYLAHDPDVVHPAPADDHELPLEGL